MVVLWIEISDHRQYTGITDALSRIIREEGVLSLYRGIAPALMLVSNGAVQFTAYEELKKLCVTHLANGDEKQLGPHHFLAMGATAKVMASTMTFPLSVTRSRLYQRNPDYLVAQAAANPSATPATAGASSSTVSSTTTAPTSSTKKGPRTDMKYRDMRHVITSVLGSEGYRGFYRGLVPHLMKTTPSSAITFLCYESVLRLIGHDQLSNGSSSNSSNAVKVDAL